MIQDGEMWGWKKGALERRGGRSESSERERGVRYLCGGEVV